uniref:C2H2-type domain-containing protein n=1 Tax=Clytia hemisphaerica TaxID=252671 RepID=A0A7M5UUH8_9CNID
MGPPRILSCIDGNVITSKENLPIGVTEEKKTNIHFPLFQCPTCKVEMRKKLRDHMKHKHGFPLKQGSFIASKQERTQICQRKHKGNHILLPCEICNHWMCSINTFIDHMEKHKIYRTGALALIESHKMKFWNTKSVLTRELDNFGNLVTTTTKFDLDSMLSSDTQKRAIAFKSMEDRSLPTKTIKLCTNAGSPLTKIKEKSPGNISSPLPKRGIETNNTSVNFSCFSIRESTSVSSKAGSLINNEKTLNKGTLCTTSLFDNVGTPPINKAYTTMNPTSLKEALLKARNESRKRKIEAVLTEDDDKIISKNSKIGRIESEVESPEIVSEKKRTIEGRSSAGVGSSDLPTKKTKLDKDKTGSKTRSKKINLSKKMNLAGLMSFCPECNLEMQTKHIRGHLETKHSYVKMQLKVEYARQRRMALCFNTHHGQHGVMRCPDNSCDKWICAGGISFQDHMQYKHGSSLADSLKLRKKLIEKFHGGQVVLVRDMMRKVKEPSTSSFVDSTLILGDSNTTEVQHSQSSTAAKTEFKISETVTEKETDSNRPKPALSQNDNVSIINLSDDKISKPSENPTNLTAEKSNVNSETKHLNHLKTLQFQSPTPTVDSSTNVKHSAIKLSKLPKLSDESNAYNNLDLKQSAVTVQEKAALTSKYTPIQCYPRDALKVSNSQKSDSELFEQVHDSSINVTSIPKNMPNNRYAPQSSNLQEFIKKSIIKPSSNPENDSSQLQNELPAEIIHESQENATCGANIEKITECSENSLVATHYNTEIVALKNSLEIVKHTTDLRSTLKHQSTQTELSMPHTTIHRVDAKSQTVSLSPDCLNGNVSVSSHTLKELVQDLQNISTTAKLFIRKAPEIKEKLTMGLCATFAS